MSSRIENQGELRGARRQLAGLEAYLQSSGLDTGLLELIKMRASQINACAFCLAMHSKSLLERLNPEQRIVYVLREGFGLSYDEIAEHIDKSAAACRQIFHRAQLRLTDDRRATVASADDHRRLAERFLAAVSTGGAARVATVDRCPAPSLAARPTTDLLRGISRKLFGSSMNGLMTGLHCDALSSRRCVGRMVP